jgi:drug/metabolite transporter (DMT)-like permease
MFTSGLDPLFATFYMSLVTWIVCFLAYWVRKRRLYAFQDFRYANRETKGYIALSNGLTLVGFWTALLAIDYTNAYVSSLIDYGGSPALTAAMAWLVLRERKSAWTIGGIALSLGGVVVLVAGMTTPQLGGGTKPLLGTAFAILSALAFAANQIMNKKFVVAGITRERIWLARLPLLVVVLGVACALNWFPDRPSVLLTAWAIGGTTIPLLLLVFAFERMQVANIACFLFLIPVFSFIGSAMSNHFSVNVNLGVYLTSGIVVLFGVVIAERSGFEAQKTTTVVG